MVSKCKGNLHVAIGTGPNGRMIVAKLGGLSKRNILKVMCFLIEGQS